MRDFVKKAEQQSKESINRSYRDIDIYHWHINELNDMLLRYMNRRSGYSFTYAKRQKEINEIREMIADTYKTINFYKECINAEKKEMRRIHDTYGYSYDMQHKYDDRYDEPVNSYYYDNESDNESMYDDDDLEEIKEYRYNHATGLFE